MMTYFFAKYSRPFAGLFCAFASALTLSGCQHRTANETLTDWVHGISGGEIYKLRPPPPYYDKPFPHIGQVPTYEPEFPSPEARAILTQNLQEHRNYAQRLSAASGPIVKGAIAPPPPPGGGENSSTLTSSRSTGQGSISKAAPYIPKKTATDKNNDNGLPELKYKPIAHETPKSLPTIGDAPPLPIGFRGFKIPSTPGAIIPDFDKKEPNGTLIRFVAATDQIGPKQEQTLQHLADESLHKKFIIIGFGTTLSAEAGLKAKDQQHELRLGLLRAQKIAQELEKRGVASENLIIEARSIGDGARIQIQSLTP
ncbi:hypothetical protein GT348_07655 [Aristophania vespae]|uniref:OmpA family protein n=1 Tax=Aristophania vespae TaxID=2697033 RepID=A0A6P1NFR4_9PROT|nr:hypothetical protein [Aristophania vespae]QHI96123.1 hypothetical protein GT348_07655 [Aristophania vespae]